MRSDGEEAMLWRTSEGWRVAAGGQPFELAEARAGGFHP
jgi:hypothetical protein